MNLAALLNEFTSNLLREQKYEAMLAAASLETLEALWNEWDGMALMKIDGEYIPEREVVQELYRRKSTVKYLP